MTLATSRGFFCLESSYSDIRNFEGLYQGAIFTALEIDYDIKRKGCTMQVLLCVRVVLFKEKKS
jgi:hypothetical protein